MECRILLKGNTVEMAGGDIYTAVIYTALATLSFALLVFSSHCHAVIYIVFYAPIFLQQNLIYKNLMEKFKWLNLRSIKHAYKLISEW